MGTLSTTATTVPDPDGLHSFGPEGLAFDTHGDLLVANGNNGSITEFAAGSTPGTFGSASTVESSLLQGAGGLALDTQGNLFAANSGPGGGDIVEVAAGATPGTFGSVTSLPDARFPDGLAFDESGDLFVSNDFGGSNNQGSITEFVAGPTPGTFGVTTTFSDPSLNSPRGMAFDARGDLFVANGRFNTITEFSADPTPGTFGMTSTFTDPSLNGLVGLAVDARGDLFAANYGNGQSGQGTITEFVSTGAGTFGAAQIIETGLSGPTFLTFGPSMSAPVPESSTTVSLGLLLVLGMGGLVVAAKKKRKV